MINFKELNQKLNIHELMGLSPEVTVTKCHFHSDEKPSMLVCSDRNSYYCFACHERGDAISYYAKKNDLSMYEAAKELAASIGYKVEGISKSPRELEAANAQKKYLENLSPKHVTYLKNRGIEDIGIEKYKLGGDGDFITQPIYSDTGRLVGHNKRSITGKQFDLDKGFDKSNYLGGINIVKNMQDPLIITESFFDVVQAYQEGLPAACTFGARLSEAQSNTALKYFNDFVIAFDFDPAGIAGAIAAFKLLKSKRKLSTITFADCDDLGDHLYTQDEVQNLTFYEYAKKVDLSYQEIMEVIKGSMGIIERKKNLLNIAKDNGCSLDEVYKELENV
jgi:DNA primase